MIENPHGKFELEGTITLPEKEIVTIKEIITELVEKETITSEIEREIIDRLVERETITEILTSLIEREVIGPETTREIISSLIEREVIGPETERLIISYLIERGLMPPEIAAEVPPKPIPWGWIVAAGSLFVSAIICLSAEKDQGGKNE